MTNVIHPAKTVAQKLTIDADAQKALAAACAAQDVADESWSTVANRFFVIGFRADHLKQKDGDKEIINIVDNAIVRTMPDLGKKLLATKPVDLNAVDKALRTVFMKSLNDKRALLAKWLKKAQADAEAGNTGGDEVDHAALIAEVIEKLKAKIHTLSVVDAKTGKCKLEGVKINKLLVHLEDARKELI